MMLPSTQSRLLHGLIRCVGPLLAAVIAAAGVTLPPSSARADVLSCLSDAANTVIDAVKTAGNVGQCSEYVANPTPTFAIALAAVRLAMAENLLPENGDDCKSAIPNASAKLILAVINGLGLNVSDEDKAALKNEAPDALNKILAQFPILAAIYDMFGCACTINASADTLGADIGDTAADCGGVLTGIGETLAELGGDLANTPGGIATSFGCLAKAVFGSSCPGSSPGAEPCSSLACQQGSQCFPLDPVTHQPKSYTIDMSGYKVDPKTDCAPCSKIAHGVALPGGKCGCSGGFVPDYETYWSISYAQDAAQLGVSNWGYKFGKPFLNSCVCPQPFSAYYDLTKGSLGQWRCACPLGQSLHGGKCELICQRNQQPVPKQDPSKVLAGSVWSCEPCSDPATTSDGRGPCELHYCQPNQQVVSNPVDPLSGGVSGAVDDISKAADNILGAFGVGTTTTRSCADCPTGEKSDGEGPCIPCQGELSFVAGGICKSCKPWQRPKLAWVPSGGSRCEDICPNGVFTDLPTPVQAGGPPPKMMAKAPGGAQRQGTKDAGAPSASAIGPPGAGGKDLAATTPGGLPSGGSSSPGLAVSSTPVMPKCIPCGENEYADNNQCHSCVDDTVVDIANRTCTACPHGTWPNANHTVCVTTASIGPPAGAAKPVISDVPGGPALRPCPPGTRLVDGACRPPSATLVPGMRLVCAAGQVPNAAGTACIRIGKPPPSVRDLRKPPGTATTTPGRRRPADLLLKRRPGSTPTPIPIPIPR